MRTIDIEFEGKEYEVNFEGYINDDLTSVPFGDTYINIDAVNYDNLIIKSIYDMDGKRIDFTKWNERTWEDFLDCLAGYLDDYEDIDSE